MNLELMKTLTTLHPNQLYKVLCKFLKAKEYTNIKKHKDFILAEGKNPICLIAHMDTVFNVPQKKENFLYDSEQKILWGVGGSGFDDRAGIYAIIELLERGWRPHILFTNGEEIGGIGANEVVTKYTKFPFKTKCKALIELDRANEKDAVYYSCDNEEFEKYIESFGFEYDYGTFTDISIIAPQWKIAAVNLSVGYMMEHSSNEILHIDWLDATIDKVEKILKHSDTMKQYRYVPRKNKGYTTKLTPLWDTDKTCLICGTPLNATNRQPIYNEEFPYCVCKSCYNQYYLTDETYNAELIKTF